MHVKGDPFLDTHYFLYHSETTRTRRHKRAIVERLDSHPAVEWVEEQRPKKRVKRDYILLDNVSFLEIFNLHDIYPESLPFFFLS